MRLLGLGALTFPIAIAASAAAPDPEDDLSFAVSGATLGLNPEFIEQRLGIPRIKTGGRLVFDVHGCQVDYSHQDNAIVSISFDVSESCQPNLDGLKLSPSTTLGDVRGELGHGTLVADCLSGCGNAADPAIRLETGGGRAQAWIGVTFDSDWASSANALKQWEADVRAQENLGPYDSSANLSCAINPIGTSQRLALEAEVRRVWIFNTLAYEDYFCLFGNRD